MSFKSDRSKHAILWMVNFTLFRNDKIMRSLVKGWIGINRNHP